MDISETMKAANPGLREGRPSDAQELCASILRTEPAFIPALTLSGVIAAQLGQPDVAIRALSRAVELEPRSFESLELAGDATSPDWSPSRGDPERRNLDPASLILPATRGSNNLENVPSS